MVFVAIPAPPSRNHQQRQPLAAVAVAALLQI